MSLKVGIVGLPNVGKSTLFNALLKRQQALAANYPFATVEPNVGIVEVPDERLKELQRVVEKEIAASPLAPRNDVPIVPAVIEFVDIAGIVKGAHKGEGLGNAFLSNIREVDLIAHVVRDFDDPSAGSGQVGSIVKVGVDLETDFETIHNELILKDLESVQNQISKIKKQNENVKIKSLLERLVEGFNEGKMAREVVHEDEVEMVNDLFLLTMKPEIVVVNVSETDLNRSESIKVSVAQQIKTDVESVVVVSAKIESEISALCGEDLQMFMEEYGIEISGLERLAKKAYERLGLVSFLTAGEVEVRAWTIRNGYTAQRASGVIHTDFADKFIKAEVCNYEDFVAVGGWKKARELGKVRLEGRDYVMKDGDVVDFKIGS
jgi:GTP-binding protein YchF